jgi:mono/diheme cytochrome c family protein
MLALPFLALGLLGGKATTVSPQAAIGSATAAPYRDILRRDAAALCADLAPTVAAQLVQGAAPGIGCETAAKRVFAETAPSEEPANDGISVEPIVKHLQLTGQHATVKVSFRVIKATKRHRNVTVEIGESGTLTLDLEEVSGSWLVSSRAKLAAIAGCRRAAPRLCGRGAKVIFFSLGEPEAAGPVEGLLPLPAAVQRAGAHEESEFKAGMAIAAQSGCAACHRFGRKGNNGPGPNLTHIGAKLSDRQIEHILLFPRAPMPSFRHLPADKFRAIVRFLTLLR